MSEEADKARQLYGDDDELRELARRARDAINLLEDYAIGAEDRGAIIAAEASQIWDGLSDEDQAAINAERKAAGKVMKISRKSLRTYAAELLKVRAEQMGVAILDTDPIKIVALCGECSKEVAWGAPGCDQANCPVKR